MKGRPDMVGTSLLRKMLFAEPMHHRTKISTTTTAITSARMAIMRVSMYNS